MSEWDNPNNGNDDWYVDENEMAPNPDNIKEGIKKVDKKDNENDIKPVRLSKKKIVWILLIIIAIVFSVVAISPRWFKGEKSKNVGDYASTKIQQQQSSNSAMNSVDNGSNFSENQPVSGGVGIYSSGSSEVKNNSTSNSDSVSEESDNEGGNIKEEVNKDTKNDGLEKVEEPSLGELREVTAAVLSKNVFKMGKTYGYMIELVVVNNDKEIELNYFCPRKTYDALVIGDTVMVQYQSSEDGIISIASVSR